MLDTGSEISVIKIGMLSNNDKIEQNNEIIIKGICESPIKTLGKVQMTLFGYKIDFVVVPNSFSIPFHGILGSDFFLTTNSKFNFNLKTLNINNQNYPFYQNSNKLFETDFNRITNINTNRDNYLPFVDIVYSTKQYGRFLIDTGSEISLIKQHLVPPDKVINRAETVLLKGVGMGESNTLGTVKMKVFGITTFVHVVPNDFFIPCEGVMGSSFFSETGSIIDFQNKVFKIENRSTPLNFENSLNLAVKNFSNYKPSESICSDNFYSNKALYDSDDRFSISSKNLDNLDSLDNYYDNHDIATSFEYDEFLNNEHLGQYYNHTMNQKEIFNELNIDSDNYELENSTCEININKIKRVCNLSVKINILDLINLDHLNNNTKIFIQDLVKENSDCFYLKDEKLGATDLVMHRIQTTDDYPVNSKQYKYPLSLKEEVDRQVKEMLDAGIIAPSNSPYNTPVWIVPKKPDSTGKPRWRLVLDFRKLNEKTVADAYPIPNISEIFDLVGGCKYYTVLDLASGFHQIKMDPRDAHKTAFSTPYGHYEFKRMPFGLRNAPATFQRLMDNVLRGLQGDKGIFVYIDDLIICSDTLEEHKHKFNLVMKRLREANLKLQLEKCEFLKNEVSYLGHVLSEKGLNPDPRKIEAVKLFPEPKNMKNVRQFLGLAGYYRRFIKNFAQIAKPLTRLLQKNVTFEWDDKANEAFEALKDALCNPPVLQFPDLNQPFNITTDASGYAVGGVLSQGEIGKDLPIAYTSRVLRGAELTYEVYEKEALAMIHSVKIFRSYIYGRKIHIITDHQPLIWFKSAELNVRVQKWRFKLSEFDYDVIYKPGRLNLNADALSRNPVEPIDTKQISVVTRRQKRLENKKVPEKLSEENPNIEKFNVDEKPNETPPKRATRGKQINYAESDLSNSDVEAEVMIDTPINRELPANKTNDQNQTDNDSISNRIDKIKHKSKKKQRCKNKSKTNIEKSDIESSTSVFSEVEAEEVQTNFSVKSVLNSDNDNQTNSVVSDLSDKTDNIIFKNIIETKEIIQHRLDHIIYFVDVNGTACDHGAQKLIESNKIPEKQLLQVGNINEMKRSNNKYLFSLCIREDSPESQLIIKERIYEILIKLRDLLQEKKLDGFSIAKSPHIENIAWNDIVEIFKLIFEKSKIKVIICKGTLKYVPENMRNEIFYEMHTCPIGGHRGVSKTFYRIRQDYYWENLKQDIQRRIQQCIECQLKKLVRLKTKQPMVITDTPGTTFEKVALDIVGPLPATKLGNEYILTMQDQLSKFCLAVPLSNALATTIADAFIKKLICIFGAPKVILTDQGRNFLSTLMKKIAKRFKIKRIRTTAFHPQSNGSLERSHHALGEFLKQYADKDNEWDQWVDIAMLNYNTCIQESTKHTPFEVVFGRLARLPSSDPLREGDLVPTYQGYVKDLVTRLTGIRTLVYDNLINSKLRSKKLL